jgi:toxin ParE1/3/4
VRTLRQPAFSNDVSDAYAYLSERNPRAADAFLDEVEKTVTLIAVFPEIGRKRRLPEIRSFRLQRFPYVVFYRIEPDSVVLLRIVHGARNVRTQRIK